MNTSTLPSPSFQLGPWLVQPSRNLIRHRKQTRTLEPRVMEVLLALVRAQGEPVGREELLERVWSGAYVNQESVSRAISDLRRALGDDAKSPRYIETVRKRGYRLMLPIEAVKRTRRSFPNGLRTTAILAVLGLITTIGWQFTPSRTEQAPYPGSAILPLTAEPGREIDPAISVDGRQVVYSSDQTGDYELFVKSEGHAPRQLTRHPGFEGHPVWAPDNRHVAFVRCEGEQCGIFAIDTQTLAETLLLETTTWSYGLDWSPDGDSILYSKQTDSGAYGLAQHDLNADHHEQWITIPEFSGASDYRPAFAPDERHVAFLRARSNQADQLGLVDLNNGDVQLFDPPGHSVRGFDWFPGGERILVSAGSLGSRIPWIVNPADASIRPLTNSNTELYNPSVSATGKVVMEMVDYDLDVVRFSLDQIEPRASRLAPSTRFDLAGPVTSDGQRVVLISTRSGSSNLWMLEVDGGTMQMITSFDDGLIEHPLLSPDDSRIVFTHRARELTSLYLIDTHSGILTRLFEGRHPLPLWWHPNQQHLLLVDGEDASLYRLDLNQLSLEPLEHRHVQHAMRDADSTLWIGFRDRNGLFRETTAGSLEKTLALPSQTWWRWQDDRLYTMERHQTRRWLVRYTAQLKQRQALVELVPNLKMPIYLAPSGKWAVMSMAREMRNDLAWLNLAIH